MSRDAVLVVVMVAVLGSTAALCLHDQHVRREAVIKQANWDMRCLDQLSERGSCEEVTEFAPDLPPRLFAHDPSKDALLLTTTAAASFVTFQQPDCKKLNNGVFISFSDIEGNEILSIDECTGHVVIAHPERMTRQALKFWGVVQKTWGPICKGRP